MCKTCGCSGAIASHSQHDHLHHAHGQDHHHHHHHPHEHAHDSHAHDTLAHPTTVHTLTPERRLLDENDKAAAHNRAHFDENHVLAINLMSSPGAGKTRLLESTIALLKKDFRIAVVVGDLETENDAVRLRAQQIPVVQLKTVSACHLDATMVHTALHHLGVRDLDVVFIENVGNLVCPASFDLGQHRNVVLLSVTEGDDKPEKYPTMFRVADVTLVTKTDLLTVVDDFRIAEVERHMRGLANAASVMPLSAKQPESLAAWLAWITQNLTEHRRHLGVGVP